MYKKIHPIANFAPLPWCFHRPAWRLQPLCNETIRSCWQVHTIASRPLPIWCDFTNRPPQYHHRAGCGAVFCTAGLCSHSATNPSGHCGDCADNTIVSSNMFACASFSLHTFNVPFSFGDSLPLCSNSTLAGSAIVCIDVCYLGASRRLRRFNYASERLTRGTDATTGKLRVASQTKQNKQNKTKQ